MPSISLARRGRVVTETESVRLDSCSRSRRVSVVFPAPDGEDSTSISPRREMVSFSRFAVIASLDVLDLLAELLHLGLEIEAYDGQGHVIRLGTKGVRLARKFLGQKVEPSADRTTLAHEFARRADMRMEPVDLLPDVRLRGDQDGLLV